ncbi:MAG: exodeoxyribonuclease V subunit gamma [Mycobacteriaceae bacterium]
MLQLHRAERTSELVAALALVLTEPPADPFATDVVAVPSPGVERWLAQRLSTVLGAGGNHDGICAGVRFPSAAALVNEAVGAATGTAPRDEAWTNPTWALLEVIDACVDEPWCALLAHHLGADDEARAAPRRGRRWATADHLAQLFRSYAAERPNLVAAWAVGDDTDGHADELPEDLHWQAELYRRLRERLGPNPAEHLDATCDTLRAQPHLVGLPARLSVFGATALPTRALTVLDALSEHRDVHLWLPHPSPALWSRLQTTTATRRCTDPTATTAQHPLLRSLGRDVRELQLRLPPRHDTHHRAPARTAPPTLLARLQADIRDDQPPAPGPGDGTIELHACHGPGRQVEVLRELLLRLFADDPTLEPRDVLVLCPDVETFAPLISATFGLGADLPHPGGALRVRLADRSLRQTNPLLDVVAQLLDLAHSRVTASQVLDLAATVPVRAMFAFTDDELERIRGWVSSAGVRWGLDESTRERFHLGSTVQNTWRTGLDRVLLGVTTAEDEPVTLGTALPLDDVDSGDVELTGRLAELVDRLQDVLAALDGEHPVQHWVATLNTALDTLCATAPDDAWQLAQARRQLAAAADGGSGVLRLADLRALLAHRLRGRPTRASFRTGNLTVCTLVPMRSVPHRVVVLLGMDDGVFPRVGAVDGDDVLARNPCIGERDVRSEDRQLLLDAVVSAGDRVLVLHTGADPVSGATRPPAVPIGELLDVLETMTGRARTELVQRHPLQPFDARQFTGAAPFSFDPVNLAGALAATAPRQPSPARVALPPCPGPVALEDLVSFAEHPVRAYLRQRLQISLPGEDDEVDDALSLQLDGLTRWAVGNRLLNATLAGLSTTDAERTERLRGTLPPGRLAVTELAEVIPKVEALTAEASVLLRDPARTVDVRLQVGGRELSGTVAGVRGEVGHGSVVAVSYSSLGPKQRAKAWVLALALAATEGAGQAVTVGRYGRRARTSTLVAPPDPLGVLAELVDLRERGLCEPLPLHPDPSESYTVNRRNPDDPFEAAAKKWVGNDFVPGTGADRHHVQVWGASAPFTVWSEQPARLDEQREGERTRFGVLSRRFWEPLLAAEQMS